MKAHQCFRIVVEVTRKPSLICFGPFVEAGHTLELLRMRPQENLLVVTATFNGVDDMAADQLVRDLVRIPRVRSATVEGIVHD